jgi:hypothetical protein
MDFLQDHPVFLRRALERAMGLPPQPGDHSATGVEPRHTRGRGLSFFKGIPGLSRKLDAFTRFSVRLLERRAKLGPASRG